MPNQISVEGGERGVARVIVARANVGNASSPEMLGEIRDAFLELSEDASVRAIVLAAVEDDRLADDTVGAVEAQVARGQLHAGAAVRAGWIRPGHFPNSPGPKAGE